MNEANDFLFSGGTKSAKFENIGDKVRGTIESAEVRQQTSIEGQPLTWDDGSPRKQLVIVLQTDQRDPEIEDDDGRRALYAKGGNFDVATGSGSSMRNAIADAVKQSGSKSLDEGGELVVAHTGLAPAKRGYSPAKLYTAQYKAPVASVAADDLFGD